MKQLTQIPLSPQTMVFGTMLEGGWSIRYGFGFGCLYKWLFYVNV